MTARPIHTPAEHHRRRAGLRVLFLLALACCTCLSAGRAQTTGVVRNIYNDLPGASLRNLTNDSNFPDFPAFTEILTNVFETPINYSDYYGQRLRALVIPPLTGTYVFWLAADDQGLLYVSPDESPFNKQQVALGTNTVVFHGWFAFATQESPPLYMEAGKRYYVELIHSAGRGYDFVRLGWKLPNGTFELPLPVTRCAPYGLAATAAPVITRHPANLTVAENTPAAFQAAASNLDPVTYQWLRNEAPIPGARGATYTLAAPTPADTAARFRCVISNSFGARTTTEATLTVNTDTTPPALLGAANLDTNTLEITFTEPVTLASATTPANYTLTLGATPLTATLGPDLRTVTLTTTPLARGSNYTLTVTGIRDRSVAANLIATSQTTFPVLLKGIHRELYTGIPSTHLADLTNNPAFPNNPSAVELFTAPLDTPRRVQNNYGQRLRARLLPPITGHYNFWLAADDSAVLHLGTNQNPSSARAIASVSHTNSVAAHQWDIQPTQKSAPIYLTAGQQYYLEILHQASVSGGFPPDHCTVRWQTTNGLVDQTIPLARLTPYGLTPPTLAVQPTHTTGVEGQTATFTLTLANLDPTTCQWQHNGLDIPGATNTTYTHGPLTFADHLATFRGRLQNPVGATTSAVATLTVTADVTPPGLFTVLSHRATNVIVTYTEPVETASATALTNYTPVGFTITGATLGADLRTVTLTTAPLNPGQTYTLVIRHVRDRAASPNTIALGTLRTFTASDFYPQDIGEPASPTLPTITADGLNLTTTAADLKTASDQFAFAWQTVRGDFDFKIRVARLDLAHIWTVAGLMMRENLEPTARYAAALTTPSLAGSYLQYRTHTASLPQTTGAYPANLPHAWLRLQRLNGTTFTAFAGPDGLTWTPLGSVTLALPTTLYLGLAVATQAGTTSTPVQAHFRDFADASADPVLAQPLDREPLGPCSRRTGLVISEIMYHPAERADGRKLEYLELFNAQPFFEDISGYRISGDVDYTFPPGTLLPGGSFLVVARAPADLQAVYPVSNVTGPYTNNLGNKSGLVRLRHRSNALLLEVEYDTKPPWPASADGAGHSLVLARPSYGEADVRAWAASGRIGGSPGTVDGLPSDAGRNVVINEFLAHTDLPDVDYIELYNHGSTPVNLSGYWLSDNPATNKFRIPDGTTLAPRGFAVFNETTLGFGLSSSGEAIFLVNSNRTEVIDSILFEGQENGVATGRFPDGAPGFHPLTAKTPGATNAPLRIHNVVINEIMYNPMTGDDGDEFVELHNRGASSINVGNWRFTDGIDFTFPTNAVIPAGGFIVAARNATNLIAKYTNLRTTNTFGNYAGALANSGERLALSMPDQIISTNLQGVVQTNIIYIVVDEVTYGTGGRWGQWHDGDGSSLELIDPRSDNRLPSNWTDSDDTAKAAWTVIGLTNALLDHAADNEDNSLQLYLLNPGECLVDDVDVRISTLANGANLVTNGGFQLGTGLAHWYPQGNHRASRLEPTTGYNSTRCLRVIASDNGDTGGNRIYTILNAKYATNLTGTLSARVKWQRGKPDILVRLRGNHLEVAGTLTVPVNLGTPGLVNSRKVVNAAPAISDVAHTPVLPAINQPVVVTARVHDPDGLNAVLMVYRVDPFGTPVTLTMRDDGTGDDSVGGDGLYTATLPGQPNNTLIAFYVQATDKYSPAATGRFPANAPTNECLVHFGSAQPGLAYGTYRFWITQASLNRWLTFEKLSNEPYEGTFVYGNFRAIYNAASHYAGSPAHTKLYDSPLGTNCDYQILLPKDDAMLAATSMRLQMPGIFGDDSTGQDESIGYWLGNQLDIPYLHRRPVMFFFNGQRRFNLYEDTQRPNSDFDEQWYPNAVRPDLYKVAYWYEYSDDTSRHDNTRATLLPFTTTGGAKKVARYRQTFVKRAVKGSAHDHTNILNLVDLLNTPLTGQAYLEQVAQQVDLLEWTRAFALQRIINNTDLYGARRIKGDETKPGSQNAFLYKADNLTWKFLIWDIDAGFTGSPTDPLFEFTDPPISNLFSQPLVLRMYWQALQDAADGPLVPANLTPLMDAKYAAYRAAGISVNPATVTKNFLLARRDYILWLLNQARSDFTLTSNNGQDFTNATTLVNLSGRAPLSARTITINGVAYPLTWTSITNWTIALPLTGRTNQFLVEGRDAQGNVLSGASRTQTVYFNGPVARPEDSLVISEIMFQPAVTNAGYVELHNRSTNTTFSLYNYRLRGVDFDFNAEHFIGPRSNLVVVKSLTGFRSVYGSDVPVAGQYDGNLDPDGETLTLIKQALTTNDTDVVMDKVKYGHVAPWAARAIAPRGGAALQLMDAAQDNARVSNWDDGSGWRFVAFSAKPDSSSPRLYLWLSGAGEVFLDDLSVVLGTTPGVGANLVQNGDFETPLVSPWTLTGTPGPCAISPGSARSGTNTLRLAFTKSGGTSTCLYQNLSGLSSSSTYTFSFWYRASTNTLTLTARLGGSSFQSNVAARAVSATPGTNNWVAATLPAYPRLWINEIAPNNPNGLKDNTGTPQPWIELFNSGTNALSLDGYSLAIQYTNLNQWAFPTGTVLGPGEFRVLFASGQPQLSTGAVLHTSFRLPPTNGSIALMRDRLILDFINFTNLTPGVSYGSWPDGQLFDRQVFYVVTPGASNNPAPVPIALNEWMASNTRTLLNPARNRYDDWLELYNFGDTPISLAGYYLTDDLGNKNKWRIPPGVTLAPQSFLLVWADNDATGTNQIGGALHAGFALSANGEALGLFSPGGVAVDTVVFGPQASDVSQGRYGDGNMAGGLPFMPVPTPGAPNQLATNLYAPVLATVADATVAEGAVLTFTNRATDLDQPAQALSFALRPGAPQGASVHPVSGVFSWSPLETHGGASYVITVVVSDNAEPPLEDTQAFTVTVLEVNSAPGIAPMADVTVEAGTAVSVPIPVSDPDVPAQTLSCWIVSGPPGASMVGGTTFAWTPGSAFAGTTNAVVMAVADNGVPSLSATQTFAVVVTASTGCTGLKGDVAPRINGNGALSVADWTQVGRFVAGLNEVSNACELARADCAPKPCGNGALTVADWVQAGRYAAGVDAPVQVCGTSPSPLLPASVSPSLRLAVSPSPESGGRTVWLTNLVVARGQSNWVGVWLAAQGDENALGFSVGYDTNLLTFVSARLGADAAGRNLNVDRRQLGLGRVGILVALGLDEVFAAGTRSVVELSFRAAEGTNPVRTALTMGDVPAVREVADAFAGTVGASFEDSTGVLTAGAATVFEAPERLEEGVRLRLVGAPGLVWEVQGCAELLGPWGTLGTVSNALGWVEHWDATATNGVQRFYRAVRP